MQLQLVYRFLQTNSIGPNPQFNLNNNIQKYPYRILIGLSMDAIDMCFTKDPRPHERPVSIQEGPFETSF